MAGIRVVLHRVGQNAQGPIDSTQAASEGRFRFAFRPDTSAFFLVSGRHAGIEYFSTPIATNPARPDTAIRIVVYDTSSMAPVQLEARHLVLTRPAEDGSRTVLDVIVLQNAGRLTRVAPDTVHGSWSMPLPRGTRGLQVNESDVSAEAVHRSGDSLVIGAPLAPGEKQLTIQYQLPARRETLEIPINAEGVSLNLLVEEPAARVIASGVALADSQVIAGRAFQRWSGTLTAPGLIRVVLPRSAPTPSWLLALLVGALALGLAGAGWYALARSRPATRTPEDLLNSIAALDARYMNRRDQTPDEEWRSYQAERARLKSELEAALAAGGWSR